MRKGSSMGEIVRLFGEGVKPAEIATRLGVSRAWVYIQLKDAGIVVRDVALARKAHRQAERLARKTERKPRVFRNSIKVRSEREDRRELATLPPPPSLPAKVNPDLFHCLGVVRALGGKGFPFGVEAS